MHVRICRYLSYSGDNLKVFFCTAEAIIVSMRMKFDEEEWTRKFHPISAGVGVVHGTPTTKNCTHFRNVSAEGAYALRDFTKFPALWGAPWSVNYKNRGHSLNRFRSYWGRIIYRPNRRTSPPVDQIILLGDRTDGCEQLDKSRHTQP